MKMLPSYCLWHWKRAKYRLVIKRSASAGYLADMQPSYSLEGKSTRFDIFALRKLPA